MKTLLFFLMFVFATCTAQKRSVASGTKKEGRAAEIENQNADIDLSFVVGDAYSGTETLRTLFITDVKSLRKFYSRINRTRKPGLLVPDIDFSKDMVIVHYSGAVKNDAMPELYVFDVTEDEIVIGTKEINGKSSSSAVTTPFVVYRMALSEKKVLVRERE